VTRPPAVTREDVLAILADSGTRPRDVVAEQIDSFGVAWLVHEAERRFGAPLPLTDDVLAEMTTVTGAARVLSSAVAGAAPGSAAVEGAELDSAAIGSAALGSAAPDSVTADQ
jgi:hypothetical protein